VAGNSRTPGRSVISKASEILHAVTEGNGYTLTEIAVRCRMPLSTVHRLANELAASRVPERTEDGRYRAGRPLRAMSGACPCACDASSLRERAEPVVEDLFRVSAVACAGRRAAGSPCPSSACVASSPRPSR
jgi:DNA-binding IclR family transcriptional regulator